MAEAKPYLFLALEPGVKTRVALELHERHLHRHGFLRHLVGRLEDGRHAASADGLGDEKAFVQGLPRPEFVTGRRVRLLLVQRDAAVVFDFLDLVDLQDLHGQVIVRAALFRQGDETAAGLGRREARHDVGDFAVGDISVQAVGTKYDPVALENRRVLHVNPDHRLSPDAPGQDGTVFAGLCFLLGDQPELLLHAYVGMVGGQLFDFAPAQEINTRISDVADPYPVVSEDDGGQGGGHPGLPVVFHALVIYGTVGGVEHPREKLLGGLFPRGLAKLLQGRLDGKPACHFAKVQPAHSVGQNGDRAKAALFLDGLRLPGADEILVVFSRRPGGRQFSVSQFHR